MSTPDRLNDQEAREKQYALLALKREEIPVLLGHNFKVPIHPLVWELPQEIRLNQEYAEEVYNQAWEWTEEDIRQLIDDSEGDADHQRRLKWLLDLDWRFRGYDISQDKLVVPISSGDATILIYYPSIITVPDEVGFSEEKARAYSDSVVRWSEDGKIRFKSYFLGPKNVINTVQAYLLRNWTVAYHNRLLQIALGLETPE